MSPPKFTYSGRICLFAQFFFLGSARLLTIEAFDAFEVIEILQPWTLKVHRISKEVFEPNLNYSRWVGEGMSGWVAGLSGNIDHVNLNVS